MAISLSKGQKVDLTKSNPGLTNITVGVGWDTNKYDGGKDFDLDSSIFLLNAAGVCDNEKDFVFFNNLEGGNGSVVHAGDNLTGEGDGDDEQVKVSLSTVPTTVERIAFAITIHDADQRSQNFGQVSNSYVRIVNDANGEELIRYDLGEDFSIETAVVVGELYRHGSEWKFNAIGSGYQGGLGSLVKDYGLQA
ncbi:TerD family protein [Sporosarcina sp. ANT_H38]|uniref:TerD family protein n=1 Tax=Sporosarcina sp. ANT_H38 TaxID=2597358 RepID=UPI0011F2C85B|nr:TerD family protein [Sporosarcina sp. ANT_H38]KAA0948527.1 TerD family protein [Sporosarcina sp. ANT_H38]